MTAMAIVNVEPRLKAELEELAQTTNRAEDQLANEALRLFLERERRIIKSIKEGISQAERGEFVPDEEMEDFFSKHSSQDE